MVGMIPLISSIHDQIPDEAWFTVIGTVVGGALIWLQQRWVAWKKDKRDVESADKEAERQSKLADSKMEHDLILANPLLIKLQEDNLQYRKELDQLREGSLQKILAAINREAECQKQLAAMDATVKGLRDHIEDQNLKIKDQETRIKALEGKA